MMSSDFHQRVEHVKRAAHDQWPRILEALGVTPAILNKKNQPCPLCGGRDRFQFTDKFGQGNYFCRGCGPGDGFKLLQGIQGIRFAAALAAIEPLVGAPSRTVPNPKPPAHTTRVLARRLWDEAVPVRAEDPAGQYLAARGLSMPNMPTVLRFHTGLGYFVRDEVGHSVQVAQYPALVCAIQAPDGQMIALHRTYLIERDQASGIETKKVLGGGIRGAAVRLYPPTEELGIAEGIETALACHLATGKPVWATLGAGNLARVWIPSTVNHVMIYADNDADAHFTGQAAAYALAERLTRSGEGTTRRQVDVFVPPHAGQDWADVWFHSQTVARVAA